MNWLIVEDALRDRKGHWLEYVSTVVRELQALGDEVVVLCDRKAQGFVMEQTGALPVLPESIWHRMGDGAGALKRYLRVPGHALATFLVMRKVCRGFNHGLHGLTRMGKAQVNAQGTCAGDAFSNPFTSELARDCENTSPTRSASGSAGALIAPEDRRSKIGDRGIGSAGENQLAASKEFLKGQSQAGLQMDSQKFQSIREANEPSASGKNSLSVKFDSLAPSRLALRAALRSLHLAPAPALDCGSNSVTLDSGPSPLDSGEAPDWIFVPTVLVHHLLGWWMLLKTGSLPKESRVLLFFPNLPIRLDEAGKAHWSGGPTTKLMAWLFEQLRGEVASEKLVLGVETHAMRRALEALIRMPVVYLPHPVPAKPGQGGARGEGRESRASSPATSHPLPATSASPIVFGCYGAARWEKGSDIFQEAIKLILKNEVASDGCRVSSFRNQCAAGAKTLDARPSALDSSLAATAAGRPLRFAIQWVEDFRDDSGNLVQLDPWLREHPQVEVIDRYFQGEEYERQLERTDVMVLPYRNPYQLRVSRVVIEAMINGMPVIATRGTTLFEQAKEYGVVVGCEDGSAESLAEAILEVAASFETMRMSAQEKANSVAESFSVGYFRELLVMGQNH